MGKCVLGPTFLRVEYQLHFIQVWIILPPTVIRFVVVVLIAAYNSNSLIYLLIQNNGMVGDTFMDQIEPLASSIPYMTCVGNHENA